MCFYNVLADGQAQAGAAAGNFAAAAFVYAVKTLKNAVVVFFGYAGTIVANGYGHFLFAVFQRKPDIAVFAAVFYSVIYQVYKYLPDAVRVGKNGQVFFYVVV